MPLRLKSLELHGYKTFASKTKFEFSGGITAIVGPNGSGKSNIADALRWVLGEQSYSLLRGKKTEDMIFSGSENRTRAGMASASIVFDNTDNWLPVDFSEVELSRHAYRDGRNDYLLNNQHVRLREINELLAQSGLSERTYTILGQGLVDASLALKADERRKLFEEAAGIGLFRSRREDAIRRLDITQRNMDRVLDIIAELEPRLKSLDKQAKRSQEYLRLQTDLKTSLRTWYGYHWHQSQIEMNQARELSLLHESKLLIERESYLKIRREFLEFRDMLQGLRTRLNAWHRESAHFHSERETISRGMAVLEERIRALSDNHQNTVQEHNRLEVELSAAEARLVDSKKDVIQIQQEVDDSAVQLKTVQDLLQTRQLEYSQVEEALAKTNQEITTAQNRRVQSITRRDEISYRIEDQQKKLEEILVTISTMDNEVKKAEELHLQSNLDCKKSEDDLVVMGNKLAENKRITQELENERKNKLERKSSLEAEVTKLKAQLEILEQSEQSLAGYADGARLILDASRKSRLNKGIQVISNLLDIPADLELAIAAALGEFIDSIIIRSKGDIEAVIKVLDEAKTGRATLLLPDKLVHPGNIKVINDPACLGIASEKVKFLPEHQAIVDNLLGRVLIITDRHEAFRVMGGIPKDFKLVTLAGEVFHASGPIQVGRQANAGILGRNRQKREFLDEINNLDRQIEKINSGIHAFDEKLKTRSDELNKHIVLQQQLTTELEFKKNIEKERKDQFDSQKRKREWQSIQVENLKIEIGTGKDNISILTDEVEKIDIGLNLLQNSIRSQTTRLVDLSLTDLNEQMAYWNTQLAVGMRALTDAQVRNRERQQSFKQLEDQTDLLYRKLAEYKGTISSLDSEKLNLMERESKLNKQLELLGNSIEPAESELENAEKHELDLHQQEMKSQQALATVERYYNQVHMDFGRKQEAVETLRQKIEDDFGLVSLEYASNVNGPVPLPFDGMVEQLVSVDFLSPDMEETITHQRMLLRRLGPINPEAQNEFDSVSERYKFLNTQLEDLRKAESDLRRVIAEMDDLTRQEFFKTFSAVADEFKSIFHRLFGGGSARLLLTNPDDLTETGIDIEARLPGKREQGLALLSGGERSLTAIALVFSLLKVSPTPVCVMDEVDAMLDEANVGRFRDLLSELSQDTQFIIITHNRNTVQGADVIYGVTMGHDSVSQIISLKLDEVSEEVLKG